MLIELKESLLMYVEEQQLRPSISKNFTISTSVYSEAEFIKGVPPHKYLFGNSKILQNVCPHRGANLDQRGSDFVCSYHGWKFDNDGRLKSASGHVCPYKEGALKLNEFKGDFFDEISKLSENSHFIEERSFKVKCNWKFLVESLLETYHFPFAHNSILGDYQNAYYSTFSVLGKNARILVPLSDLKEGSLSEDLKGINIMYYLFPYDFILFMSSGFVCFKIKPIHHGESVFECRLLGSENQKDSAKKSLAVLDLILHQDFEVLEGQQKNLSMIERYLFTGYEELIQIFHENLKE